MAARLGPPPGCLSVRLRVPTCQQEQWLPNLCSFRDGSDGFGLHGDSGAVIAVVQHGAARPFGLMFYGFSNKLGVPEGLGASRYSWLPLERCASTRKVSSPAVTAAVVVGMMGPSSSSGRKSRSRPTTGAPPAPAAEFANTYAPVRIAPS
eukprot:TRINITY_DN10881_c0_g1_i1.p2 TRINITY_DN10881_c0_g1~~TRINITY_DN10881_c0_g1_i1.p2  ORF type:complete len:150 (+),score=5.79 TRINITY_DN10881_c0_g1_i1:882-1331(+)